MVRLTTLTTEAVAVITAVVAFLRKALEHVKTGVNRIEQAKQKVDAVLAAKRKEISEEEMKLQSEIASLKAQEEGAASKLSAAKARVFELEERIKSLKEGRSLAYFLAERTRSEDYRKHLGLISTIRQDFKSLGERLDPANSDPSSTLRPVQRIILYIDDLDRVPAEKVMDVLQAVHLLLAYPLFVVVVGVDPRWLLHSLGSTYTAFQSDGRRFRRDAKVWRTTPQNYLEKIFQIPFSLRPMSTTGFGKLMSGLLTPGSRGKVQVPAKKEGESQLDAVTAGQGSGHSSGGRATPGQGTSGQDSPDSKKEPEFVINEDSLTIQEWEGAFAQKLFDVIATPRAAKRFSNIYRILKAPIHHRQLSQFEGSAEAFGEFQLPMLLLAFLIAQPAEAAIVFPPLYQHARKGKSFRDSMSLLKREFGSSSVTPVLEKLDPIIASRAFPGHALLLVEWIPRVSRFSFEVGRAIQKMEPMVKSGSG
jgi:polyhydroxyalkanoate synthesis regulator phasin